MFDDEIRNGLLKDGFAIILFLVIAGASMSITVKVIQVIFYFVDKFIIGC